MLLFNEMLALQTKQLVRNEFVMTEKYNFPIIKKQDFELDKIRLYSYSNTKFDDERNKQKTIHFFVHDYRFENVYSNPTNAVLKLKQYYALCTPDFSLYMDMPHVLQMYSTFKNRWCGAYWQSMGLNVIPTISWSDEKSFDFCFEGVEKGSIVAISTHGNKKCKEEFMLGYNKMLEILEPCAILCYGKPFSEMTGNVKIFPYNHKENSKQEAITLLKSEVIV